MSDNVTDQVTSIQRRAELDAMAEDVERLYARFHAMLDGHNSEQLKVHALNYAWAVLIHGEKPADKQVVQTVVMDHGDHS